MTITNTITRGNCNAEGSQWPWEKFCSSKNNNGALDNCVADEGSAIICNHMLQGIVSSSCDGSATVMTDVSSFYYWSLVNQLDENPYKLADIEQLRSILFGAFDFIAWISKNPQLADQFEVIKFFF